MYVCMYVCMCIYIYIIIICYLWQRRREWGNPWRILFLDKERSAPFPAALQYRVDAWSGRSKPLFRLPVPKIHLIYSPRVEDVSDIKLIRTDTTLDLSQKAEKRYRRTVQARYKFLRRKFHEDGWHEAYGDFTVAHNVHAFYC